MQAALTRDRAGFEGMATLTDALPTNTVVGGYRIDRVIGSGTFGITYLAYAETGGAPSAIKEYYPVQFAGRRPGSVEVAARGPETSELFDWGLSRFLSEAEILARLDHPNIVSIHRFFQANGTAYIVMTLESGETLDRVIQQNGPLSEAAVLDLFLPLISGVAEIHRNEVLHRDIKPSNIIVRRNGTPVLIDFGSARAVVQGRGQKLTEVLTPGYAPPEQYTPEDQGAWTDVYGMAATIFKAVTGAVPPDANRRRDMVAVGRPDPAMERLDAAAATGRYSARLIAAVRAGLILVAASRPKSIEHWQTMFPVQGTGGEPKSALVAAPGAAPEPPRAESQAPVVSVARREPRRPGRRVWTAGTLIVLISLLSGYALHHVLRSPAAICDRLASYRHDPDKPSGVDGTAFRDIAPARAVPACLSAVKAEPELARLRFQLGRAYEREKRYEDAAEQYRRATANGSAAGQWSLGLMLLNGRGAPRDEAKGLALVRASAERGIVGAYISLGWHWWRRPEAERDPARAYYWYRLAERHEPALVKPTLIVIKRSLTEQQIEAVERRLANWSARR